MKNIIVIGAGISGLSVAARLLNKGFSVTIYEKNAYIGGKTSRLEHGNFNYDLTASIVMIPNDYIKIFKDCNKDFNDYFKMDKLKTLYKAFYSDKTSYEFCDEISDLTTSIKEITKNNLNDMSGYFNFLSSNYKKYLLAEKFLLNKSFIKSKDFFNIDTINKVLQTKSLTSSYKDCSNFINNDKLKDYLSFQTMYVGVSPYSSPSIYNLIPTVSTLQGLYHIKGGIFSYVKALEKLVLDLGGKIILNSEVNKIIIKNKKTCGVQINHNNFYSDIVIASSDYSYTINNLLSLDNRLSRNELNNKYLLNRIFQRNTLDKVDKLEYSCSTFIMYLALDKKYPTLNVHNIYINKDFKDNIEAPFKGFLPFNPSLYIYCPSSIDNSFCPEGYEIMNVMVRVPNLLHKNITWNKKTISILKKTILSTLKNIEELYDIEQHLVEISCLTPVDIQNKFNTYAGSAFGLSHNLSQSLIFRPQCKSKEIEGLYFTGASIHPGNGVSMVLKSSEICSNVLSSENC